MVKALTVQLKHSSFTGGRGLCDLATPTPGIAALHEYGQESLNNIDAARTSQSAADVRQMFRQNALVWELAVALWGSLPEFDQLDGLSASPW